MNSRLSSHSDLGYTLSEWTGWEHHKVSLSIPPSVQFPRVEFAEVKHGYDGYLLLPHLDKGSKSVHISEPGVQKVRVFRRMMPQSKVSYLRICYLGGFQAAHFNNR